MRLFIAEKPSLARAIADVLPGPHKRSGHHIECGDGNVVAWCAGHILQTAPPEAYSPDYASWSLGHLPIIPKDWKLQVSTPDLVTSIQGLLRKADRVVHAGDPDREGQLLVDEVLHFLSYRGPVDRILISDVNPDAVRKALAALQPNAKFRALSDSALARQRADWLHGMNMTRCCTVLARNAGYDGGVVSVGRVQTPLLGIVVARDLAIENFRPVPYFVVQATMQAHGGATFRANWSPGPAAAEHFDEDKRLVRREPADAVRAQVQGKPASVTAATQDRKTEAAPLPYSLADLQIDAARRHGLTAQAVLDACQALYETHRLTTYPRSSCPYLPEGHHAQARQVLAAIVKHAPALAPHAAKADLSLRTKAWNDKKVTAHHAIIPTPATVATPELSPSERAVYELVCRRYLAQFLPPHEYLQTKLELSVAGETFVASGRQVLAPGWKALSADLPAEQETDATGKAEPEASAALPPLKAGDSALVADVAVADKKTQPPKRFNDASLIEAMCGVAKFVSNPNVKRILAETDGIGTEATRAAIVETLLERGFIVRDAKNVVSTPAGRALIQCLPAAATTPDMTAVWEAAMRAITDGEQTLDAFLERVHVQLRQLIEQVRALGKITLPRAAAPASSKARYTGPSHGDGKKKPRSKASKALRKAS